MALESPSAPGTTGVWWGVGLMLGEGRGSCRRIQAGQQMAVNLRAVAIPVHTGALAQQDRPRPAPWWPLVRARLAEDSEVIGFTICLSSLLQRPMGGGAVGEEVKQLCWWDVVIVVVASAAASIC